MKKQNIVIVSVILIFIVLISIELSFGNFFYTKKYYDTAIEAYNNNCTYDAALGETKANKEIGLFVLSDEHSLFLGQINEDRLVVAEMHVKNGRYAFKGTSMIYNREDLTEMTVDHNTTNTENGYVRWSILNDETKINDLLNVHSVRSYEVFETDTIYLLTYTD